MFFLCFSSLPYDMERLKVLEEEQEMLNSSLIALTTHFAQVNINVICDIKNIFFFVNNFLL